MTTIQDNSKQISQGILSIDLELFVGGRRAGYINGKAFAPKSLTDDLLVAADSQGIDLDLIIAGTKAGAIGGNVLVLDTMHIDTAHRGAGLGIQLIKQAIQAFLNKLGNGTVLMHPCPIGWPDKETRNEGMKALSKYYAKHFPIKKIARTSFFHFTVDSTTQF
jgi:predicted GNAT family acetyltransferase